jgi:hypothetical protein
MAQTQYVGRPEGVVPVNFSLDREAYELLRQLSPTRRSYGKFLSRLIYEHQARQDERARLQQQQTAVSE